VPDRYLPRIVQSAMTVWFCRGSESTLWPTEFLRSLFRPRGLPPVEITLGRGREPPWTLCAHVTCHGDCTIRLHILKLLLLRQRSLKMCRQYILIKELILHTLSRPACAPTMQNEINMNILILHKFLAPPLYRPRIPVWKGPPVKPLAGWAELSSVGFPI